MPVPFADLLGRFADKNITVGIIGLGYVGLPLARAFARAGIRVLGFDIDTHKVDKLNAGRSYIQQIPDSTIVEMRDARFVATDRFERLGEADAILICVPTPLTETREPDLSYVVNSTNAIAGQLRAGQLIVLESTTYPSTTRGDVLPVLERTGLKAGVDFYLAFSPEREDPGNQTHSVNSIPKVVGGLCERSADLACQLYEAIVPQVVRVSSPEIAEACKILENTYRAVNIALVNELKVLYDRMGIDVWEVIDAAKTKPFGFQAFYPGPGARRHGLSTRFIELAGDVNTAMPTYVVTKVGEVLNDAGKPVRGSKVAILGMAYKKDVDDPRESPGFELMDLLLRKGASVSYNDPHIPRLPSMRHYPELAMDSSPLTAEYLAEQDCVLIATDHTAYDYGFIVRHAKAVVDTRNATKKVTAGREKIVRG